MLTNETTLDLQYAPAKQSVSDSAIFEEKIKLAYKQFHICSLASIGGYIVLPIMLWNHVPHNNLIIWLALSITFLLIPPLILVGAYRKTDGKSHSTDFWAKWLVAVAFLGSSAWGSLGILLFVPESLPHQLIILFFVAAGAAISTIIAVSYQPLFWVKILPIILPFSMYLLTERDVAHITMSVGILLFYGGALVFIYKNLHSTFITSLKLRHQNTDLVDKLKTQTQAAEQASADKSRFLAAASHDLRQPLHAQMLLVDELKEQIQTGKPETALNKLHSSMHAMSGLFNELLDISKLDADIVKPKLESFNISDILEEVTVDISELAKSKKLEFRVRHCDSVIVSDRCLLVRILRNLLTNAVRYTQLGGVLLACRKRKGKLLVQVWDTGPGIPNNQSELIFNEFYQLHNPERDRHKGLGLGLAIVARLSKLLRHKISLHSRVHKGSVFSVEVPISTQAHTVPLDQADRKTTSHNLAGLKVLLVEDDEAILCSMRNLLQKWDCDVFAASSFETALNHVGSLVHGLNLIIADYRLRHNTTGMEVIDKLEAMLKIKVPAIIITGDTSPEILREIHKSERFLLHKPVTPEKLKSFIQEAIVTNKQHYAILN
ncbi:ATP-binding response regulator [Kaarinaea lacus]